MPVQMRKVDTAMDVCNTKTFPGAMFGTDEGYEEGDCMSLGYGTAGHGTTYEAGLDCYRGNSKGGITSGALF